MVLNPLLLIKTPSKNPVFPELGRQAAKKLLRLMFYQQKYIFIGKNDHIFPSVLSVSSTAAEYAKLNKKY
ncbi:hypothetical protein CUU66_19400 [Peribacillus deserti]|uniref:Uncharacterized protein n=1 Tax=Peribacillus deserti TaxID=673318 RepID=A0A2N5M1Z6_9BACI|nr:hypothetical protein CUU66_19400 [Peribacillus deserti]